MRFSFSLDECSHREQPQSTRSVSTKELVRSNGIEHDPSNLLKGTVTALDGNQCGGTEQMTMSDENA